MKTVQPTVHRAGLNLDRVAVRDLINGELERVAAELEPPPPVMVH